MYCICLRYCPLCVINLRNSELVGQMYQLNLIFHPYHNSNQTASGFVILYDIYVILCFT